MKQTAVEWYAQQLGVTTGTMLERAKEIEKEQIIDAFIEGMYCQNFDPNRGRAEQYYNETFNTEER